MLLRVVLCLLLLLLQGKRSAPPLTPQPQQQAAKKQKGSEGRPVSASAPAKGPVAKTAAAGGGCVQLTWGLSVLHALVGGVLPLWGAISCVCRWSSVFAVVHAAEMAPAIDAHCCVRCMP